VKARAELVAEAGPGGAVRLPVLRSQAPLILRRTADAVYLASGAAGPLGGDTLELRIEVRAGVTLRLRTVAAAVALPGRYGQESRLTITATVGAGARLEYLPEPIVAADGARHRTDVSVRLAADAGLVLRDEVLLGRHGERGGACRTRLAVDRDSALGWRPLLRHELNISGTDPASLGPAVLAGHRAAGTLFTVDPGESGVPAETDGVIALYKSDEAAGAGGTAEGTGADDKVIAEPWVAVMPLAGPAMLVTALAHDTRTLRRRLESGRAPRIPVLSGTGGGMA
jgi:urease accessory protein